MGYCTVDDILALMPEEELAAYTDGEGVDYGQVELAIEDASAEIDAYLTGRYETPLEPVPEIVRKICADIAVWNIISRRQRTEAPEVVLERYRAAVRLLERVSRGEISLGVPRAPVTEGQGRVYAPPQVFSREGFGEW